MQRKRLTEQCVSKRRLAHRGSVRSSGRGGDWIGRLWNVALHMDLAERRRRTSRRALDVLARRRISRGKRYSKISNKISRGISGRSCSLPRRRRDSGLAFAVALSTTLDVFWRLSTGWWWSSESAGVLKPSEIMSQAFDAVTRWDLRKCWRDLIMFGQWWWWLIFKPRRRDSHGGPPAARSETTRWRITTRIVHCLSQNVMRHLCIFSYKDIDPQREKMNKFDDLPESNGKSTDSQSFFTPTNWWFT